MIDNIILEALTEEWNNSLTGAGIVKPYYYHSEGYFFKLFNNPARVLHTSLKGRLIGCRLLEKKPDQPGETNRLLLLLRKHIEGAYINEIIKPEYERILKIKLNKTRRGILHHYYIIIELFGKMGNLILTDSDLKIIALDHPSKGKTRHLREEKKYEYPAAPAGWTLDAITRQDLETLYAEHMKEDAKLDYLLAKKIFGLGSLPAIELAIRLRDSMMGGWSFLLEIRRQRREKDFQPALYYYDDLSRKKIGVFFHIIHPMKQFDGAKTRSFKSTGEGLTASYEYVQEQMYIKDLYKRIESALNGERKSLLKLRDNLSRDLERFERLDDYRLRGELLKSNLHNTEKKGEYVEVTDFYHPEQKKMKIKIDPALSLNENAERFYKKYKKFKRGREKVKEKIKKIEPDLEKIEALLNKIKSADREGLERIEQEMIDVGLLKPRTADKGAGKEEERLPYRKFISSDGMEILVGKGAGDNEILTFRHAKDNDFWMHVAGSPGSHVAVRNPQRLDKCPPATLEEAAKLAAYYSKQRKNTRVQVHWTQRKYVRRLKGTPSGTVKVLSYMGILVKPEIPKTVTPEK